MSNTEEITNGDQKTINENKLLQNSDKNISDLQYNSNNDYNHVLSDQGDINENIKIKSNKKTNHSVSTAQNEDRQNIKNSSKQTKRNDVITQPEVDHSPQKDTTLNHPRSVFTYTAEHEIPTFLHQDQSIISAIPNMNDIHQTYLREQNSSSNTSIQDNMINMNGSYQYGPDYRKDHIGDYKAYDFEPRSQSADMLDHNIDKTLSLNDYGTTYIPLTGSSSDYSCSIDLGPRYHSPRGNGCDSDSMDYINYRLSNTSISDYTSNYRNLSLKDSDYMLNKKSSKGKLERP